MRVGGFDKRKLIFKGTIELEEFETDEARGTFCVMHRDQVRCSVVVGLVGCADDGD